MKYRCGEGAPDLAKGQDVVGLALLPQELSQGSRVGGRQASLTAEREHGVMAGRVCTAMAMR